MSTVHYFQRFSQRENVDTNNTLLLLSRIQVSDPRLLRSVLGELFADEELGPGGFEVGVQFSQQTSAPSGSVPDGMLFQNSFRVVLETKRHPTFGLKQLEAHLSAFSGEATKVLLLLSPERSEIRVPKAIEQRVAVVSRTFADIVAACRAAKVHENLSLRELVDDYEQYCFESDLISTHADRVMAIAVGTTLAENIELRLYYAPTERGYQRHQYVALYTQKSIRAIGEIENVVSANLEGDTLATRQSTSIVTREQQQRILRAIALGPTHGYDIRTDHRFFLVREFVPTSFRKTSSGGLLSKRYFSLRDELELAASAELPDTHTIAAALRERTWE